MSRLKLFQIFKGTALYISRAALKIFRCGLAGTRITGKWIWRHKAAVSVAASIYVGVFQFALAKYEAKIERLESRLNFVISQRYSPDFPALLPDLGKIQRVKGPIKPEIWNPISTFASFLNLGNKPYDEYVYYVKQYLQKTKGSFASHNIEGIDLSSTVLSGRTFDGAYFSSSNLGSGYFVRSSFIGTVFPSTVAQCGIFWEAPMDGAVFIFNEMSPDRLPADFKWASFQNNSMKKAEFFSVDFTNADFNVVNFDSANFSGARIDSALFWMSSFRGSTGLNEGNVCKPLAYVNAKLDSGTYSLIKRDCPEKIDLSLDAIDSVRNINWIAQMNACRDRKRPWADKINNLNDFRGY